MTQRNPKSSPKEVPKLVSFLYAFWTPIIAHLDPQKNLFWGSKSGGSNGSKIRHLLFRLSPPSKGSGEQNLEACSPKMLPKSQGEQHEWPPKVSGEQDLEPCSPPFAPITTSKTALKGYPFLPVQSFQNKSLYLPPIGYLFPPKVLHKPGGTRFTA